MNRTSALGLYANRKLADGYPNLEQLGVDFYKEHQSSGRSVSDTFRCIKRLVDIPQTIKTVAEVGCGPNPHFVKELMSQGYDAVGIEPIPGYVELGGRFLDDPGRVRLGSAEDLPLADNSQCVVLLDTVIEHVDSPIKTLAEIHRVLIPGGVAYLSTVNRLRFSITGKSPEFNVRFYNWLPRLLKECYVHHHLHFAPSLANYTPRPAVHWFTFADLCEYGRQVGFCKFYSKLDLLEPDDPSIATSRFRRFVFTRLRYNPWLRSLALSQLGDNIFMIKRKSLAHVNGESPVPLSRESIRPADPALNP